MCIYYFSFNVAHHVTIYFSDSEINKANLYEDSFRYDNDSSEVSQLMLSTFLRVNEVLM